MGLGLQGLTPPTGVKKIRSPTQLAQFVRIDNINYFNKSHDKLQQRGTWVLTCEGVCESSLETVGNVVINKTFAKLKKTTVKPRFTDTRLIWTPR